MKDMVGATDSSSSHVITINDRLGAISSTPPTHTMFKIHDLLRRENAMAYDPEILAIGPYHHGKERLKDMEVWKLRGLKSILQLQEERDATKYVEAMKSLEGRARECYSESFICRDADEFAEMLLLDGCFIIQFLLSVTGCHKHNTLIFDNQPVFKVDSIKASLCRDMLLLENQIPLFVLQKLFDLTELYTDGTEFHYIAQKFVGIAINSFTGIPFPLKTTEFHGNGRCNVNDVEHLLGLLHRIFCPPIINPEARDSRPSNSVDVNVTGILPTKSSFKLLAEKLRSLCLSISCGMFFNNDEVADNEKNYLEIPSATRLLKSGVTLKVKNKENPFEVTFVNGVMEIPIFNISDFTESAYCNMIAYEQYCKENSNRCFTGHAYLMDCLIDSPEDLALLRECGILGGLLCSDEAVSTMCNKLCRHIFSMKDSDYTLIFKAVNAYCSNPWHICMGRMVKLKRDYFNNPWSLMSFLAALLWLLLTVTQTVFSLPGSKLR